MNTHFLTLLLCFLGRQQAYLKADRREAFFAAIAEDCFPPHSEFFRRFPEFEKWRDQPLAWWTKAADELARDSEQGIQFLLSTDADFPNSLRALRDPPWVLSAKGSVGVLSQPSISVVGAREAAPEALQWMDEHLGSFLNCLPLAVVSGGARGVDQIAHRTALRVPRPTVVFLPSGLSSIYPLDLKDWLLPVLEGGGAFVSEFHPRTPMRKWNFHVRNRLIAGQSAITLVVQARRRSGTWMTAKLALEEGRAIGCLPASPWESSFGGNLELLNEGATLIRDAQDLLLFQSIEYQRRQNENLSVGHFGAHMH